MATLSDVPFTELLANIAAKTPTPGGGAVAAATGAIAAALAHMVVSYSLGKKSLAAHQPALEQDAAALERSRALFLELADEDARAYAELNRLMKLPDTDPARQGAYPGALDQAVRAPMTITAAAAELLHRCEELTSRTNPMLKSDLAIAAVLAHAAAESGAWNVRINTPGLPPDARARAEKQVATLLAESAARRTAVEKACG